MAALEISSSAPVCHPCRQYITIVVRDKDFIPRWTKKKKEKKCCVNECSELVFACMKNNQVPVELKLTRTVVMIHPCHLVNPILY